MQKYANSVQDPLGNAIGLASVSIYTDAAHTILATLYLDNGITPTSNPLTTNSLGEFSFYAADGRYYIAVSKTGITSQSLDDVILFDPTASTSAASINVTQSGSTLPRTVQGRLRDLVSVLDFIPEAQHAAIYTGATTADLTAYIQAAFDDAHLNKRGGVYFPSGTYKFDSITKEFSLAGGVRRTVNICGAGAKAAYFSKYTAADTNPFFDISTTGSIELNSHFNGFTITGTSKTSDGIKLTRCAYVSLEDIEITACDKAVHGLGLLVSDINRTRLRSNNIGFYLRKHDTPSTIRPNAIWVTKTVINSNSSFGIDYGDGAMLSLVQCDMEENGTSSNTATGAIIVRDTCDDDPSVAYAQVGIHETWFENNDGRTIQTESGLALVLGIKHCKFIGDEVAANLVSSGFYSIEDTVCSAGTFTISGNSSTIKNSVINVITDTCTQQIRENVYTSTFSGGMKIPVIATASLPAAAAGQDGRIVIEDGGTGDRNIVIYAGGQRFRIDGGSNV